MHTLNKQPESKMKIRFHDCDPFNHLNNARYIDYMVTARTDQLEAYYLLDIHQLAKEQQIGWVAAQTQLAYIVPAYLAEEVTIQTQLISFSEKSLLLESFMWNSNKSVLKAFMWTKLVHFDLQLQRSKVHAPWLMDLFNNVVYAATGETVFEKRVAEIRNRNKTQVNLTAGKRLSSFILVWKTII